MLLSVSKGVYLNNYSQTTRYTQKHLFHCVIVFYTVILWKFFQQSIQAALHFRSCRYRSRSHFKRWDMYFLWAWQAYFGVFQLWKQQWTWLVYNSGSIQYSPCAQLYNNRVIYRYYYNYVCMHVQAQENYDSISGWTTVWKTQNSSRFRINTDEFYPEMHDEFGVELAQKT